MQNLSRLSLRHLVSLLAALLLAGFTSEGAAGQEQKKQEQYQDQGNGTVLDMETGLQWMRCSLGQTWNGAGCSGEPLSANLIEALDAPKTFNSQGGYLGKTDWRLPDKAELNSLVHCSSGQREERDANGSGGLCLGDYQKPTILPAIFPDTPAAPFWSTSPHACNSDFAWLVNFSTGQVDAPHKDEGKHLRLLRNAR